MSKVILFDNDGTLSDSVPAVVAATNLALKQMGFEERTIVEIVDGMRLETLLRMMFHARIEDTELGGELASLFYNHLENFIGEIVLFPGIEDTITRLHREGHTLGIISNNRKDVVSRVVENAGISSCFTIIIGEDNADETKPAPGGLIQACRMLNVEPSECIYVGDSLSDSLAATAAGMQSVGVHWNSHDNVDINTLGFSFTVEKPEELNLLIKKLV